MHRSLLLLVAGITILAAAAVLPSGSHRWLPATDVSAVVFADQPGPADHQLLTQAADQQLRAAAAARAKAAQPPSINDIITAAFAPQGYNTILWAQAIAYCESTDNPQAVNASSDAEGLFQFLPTTWAGTPYAAQSPFDPVANANAAAWLLATYGPSQWECRA